MYGWSQMLSEKTWFGIGKDCRTLLWQNKRSLNCLFASLFLLVYNFVCFCKKKLLLSYWDSSQKHLGLLIKVIMYHSFSAVDRSISASLSDARDALVNAVIDSLSAYRSSVLTIQQPGLMAPFSLRLFPLYVLALLKQVRTKVTLA